jgi:hypothetical protein
VYQIINPSQQHCSVPVFNNDLEDHMKTLFNVNIIVATLFGLGFILIPATLLDLYGVSLSDEGITVARLFGSAILSFPVLLWYAGRSDDPDFMVGASRTMFIYWFLGTIFLIIAQLDGQLDAAFGWGTIGLHVLLLLWYGYYVFVKR